jgi:multiple sugar transport system substrate-binding protein
MLGKRDSLEITPSSPRRHETAEPALALNRFRSLLLLPLLAALTLSTGCERRDKIEASSITTIDFWNGFTGPDGKTMEKMVRRFEHDNPSIRVRMQIIPWAQYYDKLTLGLAFKRAPDLFICHANRLQEFAQYGAFKALDAGMAAEAGLDEKDFLPIPWAAVHYKGRVYGIPLDCHPLGLYYNRRLFRAAGIVDGAGEAKPPETWDEFLRDAHLLTKKVGGEQQWGFSFTWQHHNWYAFLYQHGGSVLTPDLRRAALNSPEGIEATTQMRGLIDKEKVAPSPEGIDAWRGFRQGRVAMALEGIYMLADLQKTEGLDYAGAPVPQFGPVKVTWAGSHVLCFPASGMGPRAGAAWKLARYLSDHSLDWADGGQIPARISLIQTDRFRAMRVQSAFAKQLPYVRYEPPSTKSTEITPFIDDAIEASLLGILTPREALDEAAKRIDRALSRP